MNSGCWKEVVVAYQKSSSCFVRNRLMGSGGTGLDSEQGVLPGHEVTLNVVEDSVVLDANYDLLEFRT